MRTGQYQGNTVQIIRKSKKTTRIKLADGTEEKVPTEQIVFDEVLDVPDAAPEVSPPLAVPEIGILPQADVSFANLMGGVEQPENPQPEAQTVVPPVPSPQPITAGEVADAIGAIEEHGAQAALMHSLMPIPSVAQSAPEPVATVPDPIPAPQPELPPVVAESPSPVPQAVSLPPPQVRRNPLPQNPPARRRILGAALMSRSMGKPQPEVHGTFPSHVKKLGTKSD